MKDTIQFGSKTIEYRLEYSTRKSLGITVTPEMEIVVKAPDGIPISKIKSKLLEKAPWILKQQGFFLSFYPKTTQRKYIGGETHLYMGRQYRLKVLIRKEESVKLKGPYIEVCVNNKSRVEPLMQQWYLDSAKLKFNSIADPLIERFKKYKVEPSSIVIREMKLRWGSCTPKGKIILNPELIKTPKGCIEYVITHELCHLVHHNHTQKFLDLQTKEMKDWEKWKTKLERLMA